MKELHPIFGTDHEGLNKYYGHEYDEPLLEYVKILAEKIRPLTEEDYYSGCAFSRAVGTFVGRYFENRIEIKRRTWQKYYKQTEIQETIEALGYDVDKFWHLLLFVFDFSIGYCLEGFQLNKSPKEKIEEFTKRIIENIETYTPQNSQIATFKKPMKISIEIERKKKFVIDETDSIIALLSMCLRELEKIEEGSIFNQSVTLGKFKNGKFENDSLSDAKLICYFAKLFFTFFELVPPKRKKINSQISLSTYLLISRLAFLTGLTMNKDFEDSGEILQGYLKQYKSLDMSRMSNGFYL